MNLNEREWKEFKLSDVCYISSGVDIYDAERIEGNIPYITSSSQNNGLKYFVSNNNKSLDENAISVNRNGSVGYAFYHPYKALYSNDCRKLKLKNGNPFAPLFITTQIMMQKAKYNYGYKMGTERLMKQAIMLPINKNGQPDWDFMGQYIENQYTIQEKEYETYLDARIQELKYIEIDSLSEKKWDEFAIGDLFDIKSGIRLTKENMLQGSRPFIGSTDSNNGITNFVSNTNESLDSNVLGVNYNGSVCEAFYHPYECIFSDDVKRLVLKNNRGNKFIYLFFSRIIYKQKDKYTYGYKFNENRMKRQMILIPVNDHNEPDYEYMEQYAINVMLRKYNQYTSYK